MHVFASPVERTTSVSLLSKGIPAQQYCLVTSVATRPSTEVILIDTGTGLLAKNKDKYTDEASALTMLRGRGYEVCQRGCALLGYVAAGGTAGVLLATRVRKKCTLPGGHVVLLVVDSQWVLIPLQNGVNADPAAAALDQAFWTSLQQYTLNNAHYYCETADLSRPFPSMHAADDPSPEFVWNEWLREPLKSLGLRNVCPTLLQGAVECSQETHPTGERYSMALLSRRSRRHPGTRYLARGLNDSAGPGNEIECELIMWTHPPEDEPEERLQWARLVWRRGTVPIWWGVNLQSLQKGLQAEVYVRERDPYKGTITYFRSLQQQHLVDEHVEAAMSGGWTLLGSSDTGAAQPQKQAQQQQGAGGGGSTAGQGGTAAAGSGEPSLQVPVTCVNLLHANPKKVSELMLSEHFHEAVRFTRKRLGGGVPIRVVNFDWHGNMGRLTEEKGVEGFWSFMDPVLRQSGLALGVMEPADASPRAGQPPSVQNASSEGAAAAAEGPYTPWGAHWRMRWRQQQQGIVRFNCADSLDRTNAATCFAMLPALQEGLRLLGISLDCGALQSPGIAALARSRASSRATTASNSAQDLQTVLNVARADSEVLREATQGTHLGQVFQQDLPPGWDIVNHQGRPLYVDHINKRTSWQPPVMPRTSPARTGFMQSAADMFARLQRQSSPPRMGGGYGSGGGGTPSSHSSRSSSLTNLSGAAAAGGGGNPSDSPQTGASSHGAQGSPTRREAGGEGGGDGAAFRQRQLSSSATHLIAHAAAGAMASAPQLLQVGGGGQGGGPSSIAGTSSRPSTSSEPNLEIPHTTDQSQEAAWGFFSLGPVTEVRERLYKEAVADYVEMFKVHGDIHSFLYTGSPAMHSHVLGLVVQGGKSYGATSGVGKLQNLRVAVQRRWNNTMSDASRQQAMELFLGMNLQRHFPRLHLLYPPAAVNDYGPLDPADLLPVDEDALHKSTELQALPIQVHHGVLAVQQDLMDLEPLDEGDRAAASRLGPGNGNEGPGEGDGGSLLLGTAVAGQRGEEEEEEGQELLRVPPGLGPQAGQREETAREGQGEGWSERQWGQGGWEGLGETQLISFEDEGEGPQLQPPRKQGANGTPVVAAAAQLQDLLL